MHVARCSIIVSFVVVAQSSTCGIACTGLSTCRLYSRYVDGDALGKHLPEFSVDDELAEAFPAADFVADQDHYSDDDAELLRYLESGAAFHHTPVQVDVRTLTDDQREDLEENGFFTEAVSDDCPEYGYAPGARSLAKRISDSVQKSSYVWYGLLQVPVIRNACIIPRRVVYDVVISHYSRCPLYATLALFHGGLSMTL